MGGGHEMKAAAAAEDEVAVGDTKAAAAAEDEVAVGNTKTAAAAEEEVAVGDTKTAAAAEDEEQVGDTNEEQVGEAYYIIPHLDAAVMSKLVAAMPTRAAYRCSIVSNACNALLKEPPFLMGHLKPKPHLPEDEPGFVIFQPTAENLRPGYSHLAVMKINEENPAFFKVPVKEQQYGILSEFPGGAPAPVFFKETVPSLDMAVVASEGRLLLGRSTTNYYVCNPADNRWVQLPLPTVTKTALDTAAGFTYSLDEDNNVSFNIVLLLLHDNDLLVQTFSSTLGAWVERNLGVHMAAGFLPPESPAGIFCCNRSFYWVSRWVSRRLSEGRCWLICYDMDGGFVTLVDEPETEPGYPKRMKRSLGSTNGNVLRFCSCDTGDDLGVGWAEQSIQGRVSVWHMGAAGEWQQRYVVELGPEWLVGHLSQRELPFDFACASSRLLVVKKSRYVLVRHLQTGHVWFLTALFYWGGS